MGDLGIAGFGQDMNNELYLASITNGNIYRLVEETLTTQNALISEFRLRPNPVSDRVFVHGINSLSQVHICDPQGKLIKTLWFHPGNMDSFSVKELAKGLYIVELTDASGQKFRNKLLKN